ncbi:efflux RND transporter permease subunit [Dehalogenimonas alkenigignens]|uniref:Putative exporters of the RND superfamily n=1 Tax=Dehalogenimonas alkenigignens TaxID=1217799 RepID=A0A0W0GGB1_9CHLR|nr:MMPL family transporter [Dehalogenimonas alkenigignens]KTB47600.1 putative exporters of the RND superfamily [Dehalogenimonas alkenigignens]PVV82859.1 RND family transporter [Dehalogenimonas alkenigignens]
MDKIAGFVTRRPKIIIAIVALTNLAALLSFFRFSLDTEFLNFFDPDNEEVAAYHQLNLEYGTGEAVTVLVESDNSLLERANLLAVFDFQSQSSRIPGVQQVQSYIPAQMLSGSLLLPVNAEFIQSNAEALGQFVDQRYFLTDQFLSGDRKSAVVVVSLDVGADSGPAVDALRQAIDDYPGLRLSIAGNPVIKDTVVGYLANILFILLPFAIGLILLVFYFILRHKRLTPLAMLPAAFGALWTFGTIFYSGHELSLVTVISPIFIIVMGSAYGLHYVSHFQENLAKSGNSLEATHLTMKMVGLPIILATLTTMAGFASLIWSEAIPMRQMGIFVTLGIGYAGLLAIFFLPALISHLKLSVIHPPEESRRLGQTINQASTHRVPIILGCVAVIIASAVFIPKLEVVSDQLMFFKESSEIRQASARIEATFGSAQPLIGQMVSPDGSAALFNPAEAARLLAVERQLEAQPGIKSVISVFDLAVGFNRMTTGTASYPQNPAVVQAFIGQLGEDGMKAWVNQNGFRLLVRPVGLETDEIKNIKTWTAGEPAVQALTGMPMLFDEFNRIVVNSQISSLGLALALVFVMLVISLRSLKAALVGMLPIVLTIGVVLTFLVISGFNLNILTANLSAIVIGVGVDYSIHLISGIYYFRRSGLSENQAVASAIGSVSRPVLANAFGLSLGLSVLFFSPLLIHIQAAAVMWVAMVFSSIAALLVIPQFYRGDKRGKASTGPAAGR